MPMNWNTEADAKLFAAVLKVHDVKLNYASLATEMGPECTAKAITHRIAKIKNDVKANGNGGGRAGSSAATPKRSRATPKSAKAAANEPASLSSRQSRNRSNKASYSKSDFEDDDNEDVYQEASEDLGGESPSKEVKEQQVDDGLAEAADGV